VALVNKAEQANSGPPNISVGELRRNLGVTAAPSPLPLIVFFLGVGVIFGGLLFAVKRLTGF